jgi:hypothetical protein
MQNLRNPPLIGIVGVCASGKSTLIANLTKSGFTCRHIAQEHSYVANMWKRLTNPDILIYLQVSYQVTVHRRQINWTKDEYKEQLHRLRDARSSADLVIDTDMLTPEELTKLVVKEIQRLISNPN